MGKVKDEYRIEIYSLYEEYFQLKSRNSLVSDSLLQPIVFESVSQSQGTTLDTWEGGNSLLLELLGSFPCSLHLVRCSVYNDSYYWFTVPISGINHHFNTSLNRPWELEEEAYHI